LAKTGGDVKPLERFWDNLSKNPSKESRDELFLFLEHNHVPLTEDGHFIAYKGVNNDYTDRHSGEYDNSPGKKVSMKRSDVDNDRSITCSRGLHVASFHYAKHEYGGDRLIMIKVNPKDVVSVPNDYNNQKMRCCEYRSLGDYTGEKEFGKYVISTLDTGLPSKISINNKGQLRLFSAMIRKLGCKPGEKAHVYCLDNTVKITKDMTKQEKTLTASYTVDNDYSFRISPSVLETAGLKKRKQFSFKIEEDKEIVIS
jgi:hypothetical protein